MPNRSAKVIFVQQFRDGLVALDENGKLWFGIANYGPTPNVPILSWVEMLGPEVNPLPAGTPIPPFQQLNLK